MRAGLVQLQHRYSKSKEAEDRCGAKVQSEVMNLMTLKVAQEIAGNAASCSGGKIEARGKLAKA